MPPPDGLFGVRDGAAHLVVGWSPTSGRYHFPRQPVCPYAATDDVVDQELTGRGTLFGWTAVTSAPPGYDGPVPYGLGVVQFDRYDLRVVGRLTEADPSALRLGQPMQLVVEALPGGGDVWAFAPTESER